MKNARTRFTVSKELASSTATGHVIFTAGQPCQLIDLDIRSETLWAGGSIRFRKRKSGSVEALNATASATLIELTAAKDMTTLVARTNFDVPLTGTAAQLTFNTGDQLVCSVASAATPAVGTVVDAVFDVL